VAFYEKCQKKNLLAIQIEKTEINILQKEWGKKAFLLFKIKKKNFLNVIDPFLRRVDTSN